MALPSALHAALYPPGAGNGDAFGAVPEVNVVDESKLLFVEGRVTRAKFYSTKLFFFGPHPLPKQTFVQTRAVGREATCLPIAGRFSQKKKCSR